MTRSEPSVHRSSRISIAVAGLTSVALLAHAARYLPFIADDALISLRYSRRLLQGRGLTWTDGEYVEGYTNLLWVLACAALGALGIDLLVAVRLVAIGTSLTAVVALIACFDRRPFAAASAGAVVACAGPVAVWTVGGLEAPMVAALVMVSFVLFLPLFDQGSMGRSRALMAGGVLALLVLTRPDGPIWPILFGLSALVVHRTRSAWNALVAAAVPPLGVLACHTAFRLVYYNDWVPNTWHLKGQLGSARLVEGMEHVQEGLWPFIWMVPLAMMSVAAPNRGRVAAAWTAILGWCAYISVQGGDYMPAHRHLVPVLFLLAVLVGEGTARWLHGVWTLVPPLAALATLWTGWSYQPNVRALSERWEWDGQVIGELYRDGFAPVRPYLAVTAAGTLPYFSDLPSLDMRGLTDRHIARTKPTNSGGIGHDHADGPYTLERRPDLMVFGQHRGGPAKYPPGRAVKGLAAFEQWSLRRFEGFEPHYALSEPYVRMTGPLGPRRYQGRVEVGGWLLQDATGVLLANGAMGGRVDKRATFEVQIPAGNWAIDVVPRNPHLTIKPRQVDLEAPRTLQIQLDTKVPTYLQKLVLVEGGSPRKPPKRSRPDPIDIDVDGWIDPGSTHSTAPPLVVPDGAILEVQLTGGRKRGDRALRVLIDGKGIHAFGGSGKQGGRKQRLDLSQWSGRELQLELLRSCEAASCSLELHTARIY